MDRTPITDTQLRTLYEEEGLSQAEITRRTGIPKSTLNDRIRALGLTSKGAPAKSTPKVYAGTRSPKDEADLQALLAWWRDRQATLSAAAEGDRQTERTTFHVEKRWIEAIRRQADLDGQTITQIVNKAFQAFFSS
jgi:transposase